jgi:hypothetical protein
MLNSKFGHNINPRSWFIAYIQPPLELNTTDMFCPRNSSSFLGFFQWVFDRAILESVFHCCCACLVEARAHTHTHTHNYTHTHMAWTYFSKHNETCAKFSTLVVDECMLWGQVAVEQNGLT